MTKNKLSIYIAVGIIIMFFAFVFLRNEEHVPTTVNSRNETGTENKIVENKVETNKIAIPVNLIEVSVKVIDKNFNVKVADGSTALEAMEKLANENKDFKFVGKNYGSMGIFIESINGIDGTNKKFWIYYVNNEKASVGVSKYVLRSGDIISWNLEDSY